MAAAGVPGHRQARFACLKIATSERDVVPGVYVVVLATAVSASRGGDEIWGCAVTDQGRNAGEGPVNVLLAALAEGKLEDGPVRPIERIERLADRAMNQLRIRHQAEQDKRDGEFDALRDAKLISLQSQYERRKEAIENRIATARTRGRGDRTIELFRSQLRRATERQKILVEELQNQAQPVIGLEPLAACIVDITVQAAQA